MLRSILLGLALSAVALGSAVADDREEYTRINKLIQANEFDQAESGLAEALKEYPESRILPRVHYSLYSAYRRASKMKQALPHLEAYVDAMQAQTEQSPPSASMFASYANLLVSNLAGIEGRKEEAAKRLDDYIETLERLAQKPNNDSVQRGLTLLQGRKLSMLIAADQKDEARKLLQSLVDANEADLKKNADDVAAIVRRMSTYQLQSQYTSDLTPGQSEAIQKAYGDFVSARIKEHPENVAIGSAFFTARVGMINAVRRSDPKSAKKLIDQTRTEIETLSKESDTIKKLSKQWLTSLNRSAASIEAALKRLALIGTDAFPLGKGDWANGSSLTDDDLKGKVVLLDFWAVWCGPCIATFPHLRDWNEKYASKGFEIVGVTRYYGYKEWDAQTNRGVRAGKEEDKPAPQVEQDVLKDFAAHHELKHRFFVSPDGLERAETLAGKYMVSGIPQAVLIDRQGSIRMIRVGSGDKNAHDLEEEIEKLLAE